MIRQLVFRSVLVALVAGWVSWGNLSPARAQEEAIDRAERQLAELREVRRNLQEVLQRAERQGEERAAARARDELAASGERLHQAEVELENARRRTAEQRGEVQRREAAERGEQAAREARRRDEEVRRVDRREEEQRMVERRAAAEREEVARERATQGAGSEELQAARGRLEHLRAAQRHLQEGAFPDLAEMVGRQADQLQQRLSAAERPERGAEGEAARTERTARPDRPEGLPNEWALAIHQLRRDLDQLREEVARLRARGD